jgi:hypothetical protein
MRIERLSDAMTRLHEDEQLADEWLGCALGRSISHEEHLRISFVLLRRHGRVEGGRVIARATRDNCVALDAAERYDAELTERWTAGLADALEENNAADTEEFLGAHPEFRRSDLYGRPAWQDEPDLPAS